MIYYKNLHNSPHYSVTFHEYCRMAMYVQTLPVEVTTFETDRNYFLPKTSNVMVMNIIQDQHLILNYINFKLPQLLMLKRTTLDKKGMLEQGMCLHHAL